MYAPAILSSFDLSFTIHSSQSQSHDTIPLTHRNMDPGDSVTACSDYHGGGGGI